MNRRSFLKFLGIGAAVAVAPSIAFESSQVTLAGKEAALVKISKDLLLESSPSVEELVRADLAEQLMRAMDERLIEVTERFRNSAIDIASAADKLEPSNEKTNLLEIARDRVAVADEHLRAFKTRAAQRKRYKVRRKKRIYAARDLSDGRVRADLRLS